MKNDNGNDSNDNDDDDDDDAPDKAVCKPKCGQKGRL